MKILHVTDAASAGVLASVTALARAQADLSEVAEVALAYVPRTDSPNCVDIQAMAGQTVSVQQWSTTFGASGLLALSRRLARVMQADSFDVIHLHSSRAGFLGRMLAAVTRRRDRVVYSPHCFSFARNDLAGPARAAALALENLAVRCGERLILVSDSEVSVSQAVLPGAVTAVVPNAVDNDVLDSVRRNPATRDAGARALRVVHVGRLAGQKAPQLFAAVARTVTSESPVQVEFDWLGEGDRTLLGDDSGVTVSGWLEPPELRRRLAAADLVLFTSRGEGMPMALLEAQALGRPIVASRVVGVVDVVDDGRTGYLAGGLEEHVESVLRLLGDEALRRRMGEAARARSRSHFDTSQLGRRSLSAYAQLGLVPQARRQLSPASLPPGTGRAA